VPAVAALAGCSWAPLKYGTSLSPAVQADTVAYNDAVGDAADQILLTNIVRAMYQEPLNLSQLSSISGALSFQGTLGFTLPWGTGAMGGNPVKAQNQATPSIMASTTPTYSLTPLNTQAFMLSILQPVSAAYVLNRWQAGLSREMLLRLFVKEIDFPNALRPGEPDRYINDPDDDSRLKAFNDLVDHMVASHVQLKAFDVMDPVGPPFSLYASTPTTTAGPSTKSSPTTDADSTGFGLISGSNDGQYHVGNKSGTVDAPDGSTLTVNGKTSPAQVKITNGGQLYRVYAGQVELCVDAAKFKSLTKYDVLDPDTQQLVAKLEMDNAGRPSTEIEIKIATDTKVAEAGEKHLGKVIVSPVWLSMTQSGAQLMGAPSATPAAKAGPAAAGNPAGGGTGQAVTAALQAGRISAMVASIGCKPDELILPISEEEEFAKASESFVHVQWRSVSEIFEYLGGVLRYASRSGSPITVTTARDDTVQPPPVGTQSPLPQGAEAPKDKTPKPLPTLFQIARNGPGRLSVSHNGAMYAVADIDPKNPKSDYTMTTLSILNVLVDLSAQPTVAPSSSQPLRLLPLP